MISRKQKSLFRKTLNKLYPYAIILDENGKPKMNLTLFEFKSKRKTFKLKINPIKK